MPKRFKFQEKDKGRIFFTSDTHYGHNNILKYCNRPFDNLYQMNLQLINNYNAKVPDNGIVFILGDFAWRNFEIFNNKLKGTKHFLAGNHDHKKLRRNWPDVIEITIGDVFIVCNHYPMVSWNRSFHGSWHLFGHVHQKYKRLKNKLAMNVGVDVNNYFPISLLEIEEEFRKNP